MKHKDSKPWKRKATDIINATQEKNYQAYNRIIKYKNYKKKYLVFPVLNKFVQNYCGKKALYLGYITNLCIIDNESFIKLTLLNGSHATISIAEQSILSSWSFLITPEDNLDKIVSLSLNDCIVFDDMESARLYADMLD